MAEASQWNRPKKDNAVAAKGSSYSNRKGRPLARGLLAALIVVIGGVLAFYFICGQSETPASTAPKDKKRGKIAEVEPSIPKAKPKADPIEEAPKNQPAVVKRYGHSSNVPSSDTNRIHKATMNGVKVVGWDGKERTVQSKPIFKSRVDNMLWAAIRPGGMPSGLNAIRTRMRHQTGSDAAFLQALRTMDTADFAISDDDPPHVQTAKETTKEIKERIVEEMDNGRSFDDIYQEISETTYKERMYERITQEEMRKLMKEGDPEAVRKYAREMNPVMEEMGLKTLRLPSWAEEEQPAAPAE